MWMWEKYTTLLHWLFFITEGKLGPPQSLPHHRKYGEEMSACVCVCVQRNAQEKEKKTEEEIIQLGKGRNSRKRQENG